MARGTFANIRLFNKFLNKQAPQTLHLPSGETVSPTPRRAPENRLRGLNLSLCVRSWMCLMLLSAIRRPEFLCWC